MEDVTLIKNAIEVCTRLENLCEGFDTEAKNVLISSKLKILLEVDKQQKLSPSSLISKIGLAKSNIALICKSLVDDGLIQKQRDEVDARIIFYALSPAGKKYLDETLEKMAYNFNRELEYKKNSQKISQVLHDLIDLIKE